MTPACVEVDKCDVVAWHVFLRLIVDSDFLLSLLIPMLNLAAEWKSSLLVWEEQRWKGFQKLQACLSSGLLESFGARILQCHFLRQESSPMALGGSTGDKLVSFQTEIWVHMTRASSCPRRGAPCSPHAQPVHGLRVHTPWFQEADTKKCNHEQHWIYTHACYQAILRNVSPCPFLSIVWHFNTGPSYNFFKLEEKKTTATQCSQAFPEIVWNQ